MKRFVQCFVAIVCVSLSIAAGAYSQAPPAPTDLTAKVIHASGDSHSGMAQEVASPGNSLRPRR